MLAPELRLIKVLRQKPFEEKYPEEAKEIKIKIEEFTGLLGPREVVIKGAYWRNTDSYRGRSIEEHDQIRRVLVTQPGVVKRSEEWITERHHKVASAMISNYRHDEKVLVYTDVFKVSPTEGYFNREVARFYLAQTYDGRGIRYGMRVIKKLEREFKDSERLRRRVA